MLSYYVVAVPEEQYIVLLPPEGTFPDFVRVAENSLYSAQKARSDLWIAWIQVQFLAPPSEFLSEQWELSAHNPAVEILALRWQDVDLKNRLITVQHSKPDRKRFIPMDDTLHPKRLLAPIVIHSPGSRQRTADVTASCCQGVKAQKKDHAIEYTERNLPI